MHLRRTAHARHSRRAHPCSCRGGWGRQVGAVEGRAGLWARVYRPTIQGRWPTGQLGSLVMVGWLIAV